METYQINPSEKNGRHKGTLRHVSDGVSLHFSSGVGPLSPLEGFFIDATTI